MSQELKLQMGDQLPGAMRAMARAAYNLGITSDDSIESMNKAMKEGRLVSEEVLPEFSKELWKAANQGGALEEAMQNTGSAIGRFQTNLWMTNKQFNEGGFDEGVRNLINSVSEFLRKSERLSEGLGYLAGGIANRFRVIFEVFETFSFGAEKFGKAVDFIESKGFNFEQSVMGMVGALALLSKWFKRLAVFRKIFWWLYAFPWALSRSADALQGNEWGGFAGTLANIVALLTSGYAAFKLFGKGAGIARKATGWMRGGSHTASTAAAATGGSVAGASSKKPSAPKPSPKPSQAGKLLGKIGRIGTLLASGTALVGISGAVVLAAAAGLGAVLYDAIKNPMREGPDSFSYKYGDKSDITHDKTLSDSWKEFTDDMSSIADFFKTNVGDAKEKSEERLEGRSRKDFGKKIQSAQYALKAMNPQRPLMGYGAGLLGNPSDTSGVAEANEQAVENLERLNRHLTEVPQMTQQQAQQQIIQGGITINVEGSDDPETVSERVLETIQGVFRDTSAMDPVTEQ